ncbi:MAG: 30S ribosomal protein S6 [bacterium]
MENTEIKGTRAYEISFLLKSEEDVHIIVNYLSEIGGEIINEGIVSRIRLAYPIKKEHEAYFGFIHFTAVPLSIAKLDEALEIDAKVLRFLIVTPPFLKQARRRIHTSVQKKEEGEKIEDTITAAPADISNAALEEKIEEMSSLG